MRTQSGPATLLVVWHVGSCWTPDVPSPRPVRRIGYRVVSGPQEFVKSTTDGPDSRWLHTCLPVASDR